jgi:hypothetical protein
MDRRGILLTFFYVWAAARILRSLSTMYNYHGINRPITPKEPGYGLTTYIISGFLSTAAGKSILRYRRPRQLTGRLTR